MNVIYGEVEERHLRKFMPEAAQICRKKIKVVVCKIKDVHISVWCEAKLSMIGIYFHRCYLWLGGISQDFKKGERLCFAYRMVFKIWKKV